MNFLACDGSWVVGGAGDISCSGALVAYTGQELRDELYFSSLSAEETQQLLDATLVLFITVFGFLVLKKVL